MMRAAVSVPEISISIDTTLISKYIHEKLISSQISDCNLIHLIDITKSKSVTPHGKVTAVNFRCIEGIVVPAQFDEALTTKFPHLTQLEVSNCGMSSISLSGMPMLQILDLSKNKLSTLNINNFQCLQIAKLSENWLRELNISGCPCIKTLDVRLNSNLDIVEFTRSNGANLSSLQTISTSDLCDNISLFHQILPYLPNLKHLNGVAVNEARTTRKRTKLSDMPLDALYALPNRIYRVDYYPLMVAAISESKTIPSDLSTRNDMPNSDELALNDHPEIPRSEIFQALEDGNSTRFEKLIKDIPQDDLSRFIETEVNISGLTILHKTCKYGDAAIVRLILRYSSIGVNVKCRSDKHMTPLHYCCQYNFKDVALVILDEFAGDANCTDVHGRTALHHCAIQNNIEIAELIIDRGANLDARDSDGNNSLHIACQRGHGNFVDFIMRFDSSFQLFSKNNHGLLPNSTAPDTFVNIIDNSLLQIMFNQLRVGLNKEYWLKRLEDCFHDSVRLMRRIITYSSLESGQTFLMLTCYAGDVEEACSLIQLGADVCAVDSFKISVSHYAICGFNNRNHTDWPLLQELIRARASVCSCECAVCRDWLRRNNDRLESLLLPMNTNGTHEVLSEDSLALKRAIVSGEIVQVSASYIMHCTNDFDERNKIGTGAFADVYRACDTSLHEYFAVKIARKVKPNERSDIINSLKEEVGVISRFHHPYIVRVLGSCEGEMKSVGEDWGLDFCIIMEFGANGSLDKIYQNEKLCRNMNWRLRIRMMSDIAKALSYMHNGNEFKAGHRDIKSANVVVTSDFHAKLIDCGTSVLVNTSQLFSNRTMVFGTGPVLGTQGYMCQRYINSGKFEERSDVFSFGILMLEIFSGKLTTSVSPTFSILAEDDNIQQILPDSKAGEWPITVTSNLYDIISKCVGNFKKRPKFMELCQFFAKLEQSDAGIQAADISSMEQLEHRQIQAQRCLIETVESKKSKDWSTRNETPFECKICFSMCREIEGILCVNRHFTCSDCFGRNVSFSCTPSDDGNQLTKMRSAYAKTDGRGILRCPFEKCDFVFEDRQVVSVIQEPAYSCYTKGKRIVIESVLNEDLRKEYDIRLQSDIARLQAMSERERKVYSAKLHVVENILTLKCPREGEAFLDFEGCMALTCHKCQCGFCGYCLKDCGPDAHAHVLTCTYNRVGGYFSTKEIFNEVQKQRRTENIQIHLNGIQDMQVRIDLIQALLKELRDLNIDPTQFEILDN